jgi:hypothetical protein
VFEQFKKEVKAETGENRKWVMSFAQYRNRTATAYIANVTPYEDTIAKWEPYNIPGNDWYNVARQVVESAKENLAKYGTPETEADKIIDRIVNSKAYSKFAETFGVVKYTTEVKTENGNKYKYLRLHY